MTRNHLLAVAAGLLALTAACDELVKETPTSFLAPENFFQTSSDAITAVNGVYANMRGQSSIVGWRQWVMVEYPGPTLTAQNPPQPAREHFDQYTWTATTDYLGHAYEDAYRAITHANAVIENVPGIAMNEDLKNRVLGEARFLRSLYYFNLVRFFGGVPLMTEVVRDFSDVYRPRASADEVYALIIEDLKFAEQHLPVMYPASDYGRATRGAAQMLLGKVYLTRGVLGDAYAVYPSKVPTDLADAVAQFRKVVESNQYALVPDYAMLFDEATEVNSEVIFPVVHIEEVGLGGNIQNYQIPTGTDWGSGQWIHQNSELPFYLSYDVADQRREVSWVAEYTDDRGMVRRWDPDPAQNTHLRNAPSSGKFVLRRPLPHTEASPLDYPYMRYADLLLLFAEALNEQNRGPTGEAVELVNQVRRRAGLQDLPQGLDYQGFREALFQERLWELTQEFHYYFDAQRFWDLNVKHNQAHAAVRNQFPAHTVPPRMEIAERHRVLPLPATMIDRNPALQQNPGY